MNEEEIIKELDKVINNNKDKAFMTGELNYVAMAESCKFKILDLQTQLQQKENIIKEVRKKLIKSKEYQAVKSLGLNSKMSVLIELEEILDKENKEVN